MRIILIFSFPACLGCQEAWGAIVYEEAMFWHHQGNSASCSWVYDAVYILFVKNFTTTTFFNLFEKEKISKETARNSGRPLEQSCRAEGKLSAVCKQT